jgi:threonine/homoserine/homoserine lactone efflux protein
MGEAIGQMLPFAVGVMVSPMPVVAIVLMLVTPQARSNGIAFVLGWILGIGFVGVILLLLAATAEVGEQGEPAAWIDWLKLLLGLLLLVVAIRQWAGRPDTDADVRMPKWLGALDSITPVKATGLALLLGTVNPKNLVFIIGGAAAVAETGIAAGGQAIAWVVFTAIASVGVAAPLAIYLGMGDRSAEKLEGMKSWMIRNNAAVMAVLCLVVGAKLIGDAITGLST